MAEEIKSPSKKPSKRQRDLFHGCFGCGSRTTFKSMANAEVKKKAARGRGPGLYWSISKSTASTVPVEAAAAAIVATVKTAVESDKSGVIRRYSQRRLDRAISAAAAADGLPPEVTQEKSRDDGQTSRRTESDRKKRPLPPPPPPPPLPPIAVTASSVIRPKPESYNRLDPIVGMSIVMVTLMVLVSWGQLCAILCTAAWFYFLPRLRTQSDGEITNKAVVESFQGVDDYFSSEEYKKKVVLEGLLHRNHRDIPHVT